MRTKKNDKILTRQNRNRFNQLNSYYYYIKLAAENKTSTVELNKASDLLFCSLIEESPDLFTEFPVIGPLHEHCMTRTLNNHQLGILTS